MANLSHTVSTKCNGTLRASAQERHGMLMLNYTQWPDTERRFRAEVQFGIASDQARQLYHLLDRVYNPIQQPRSEDSVWSELERIAAERVVVDNTFHQINGALRSTCWMVDGKPLLYDWGRDIDNLEFDSDPGGYEDCRSIILCLVDAMSKMKTREGDNE